MIVPDHVKAIIAPAVHVVRTLTGIEPRVEIAQTVASLSLGFNLCVGVQFDNEAEGGVFLMTDRVVGRAIAKKMSLDPDREPEESEVVESLMEMLNMIAGHAVGLLAGKGIRAGISPPTVFLSPPEPPFGAKCGQVVLGLPFGHLRIGIILAT